MGIKICYRKSCENTMCDRYSKEYGYICDECFDELVKSGPLTRIDLFMQTSKKEVNNNLAYNRYNEVFQIK